MSVSRRVWITEPALVKAASIAAGDAEVAATVAEPPAAYCARSRYGHSITTTPTKPTVTAVQR